VRVVFDPASVESMRWLAVVVIPDNGAAREFLRSPQAPQLPRRRERLTTAG
jgi:hypothetical protein